MNTVSTRAVVAPADSRSAIDIVRNGASRCVACGLCLPHCPTYRKTKSELESPRGRLSLMLAMAKDELEPTLKLESHLSLCLQCRSCEAVCPAGVPFGEAMDAARAHIRATRRISFWRRVGLRALTSVSQPRRAALAARLLNLYQKSGIQALFRASGILRLIGLQHIDAEIPRLAPHEPLEPYYAARNASLGAVALFTGCVARVTDAQTLRDTVAVLTSLGYDVHIPTEQRCCGALHLHEGDSETANQFAQRNVAAFADKNFDAIITTSSGCAATLVEYRGDGGKPLAAKVTDISAFLARIEWPSTAKLRPLTKKIAVHDPCTLTNVQRASQAPYSVLRRIPGAEIIALPGNNQCCGAAGAYHLEHPEMARSLRNDKIDDLRRCTPDILATSNVGCAMHIAAGLRGTGGEIETVHPVTLLARQLDAPR